MPMRSPRKKVFVWRAGRRVSGRAGPPPISRGVCPGMAAWLFSVAAGVSLGAAELPAESPITSPEDAFARQRVSARRDRQAATAAGHRAFHGFRFRDVGPESGIDFQHMPVEDAGKTYKAAHYDHGNGVAVADFDGDGRLDLYFTTQLGENRLFRNLGGARFADVTAAAGVGMKDAISVAAAFADADNDGDADLMVTTVRHGNRYFENQGGGRFRDATRDAGLEYSGHSSGVVWVDIDRDGLLDLLVVNVGSYTLEEKGPGGFHRARPDAFQGHLFPDRIEYSILYRNLGGGRFRENNRAWGFRDGSWSGDATFSDLNDDGFPELYLVNMQGDDRFWENRGGRQLVERTGAWFPRTPWGATGVKFLDVDNDGRMDLFVTDMHSDMTQPQTRQALEFRLEIEKAKSEAWCSAQWPESYYQGMTNNLFGNAFYRNLGDGKFAEQSDAMGLETYWPWGVSAGDVNADGFEDLLVTAGMGYPFRYALNSLLLNEAGRRFFDAELVTAVEPRQGGRTEKVWFTLDCGGADRGHPGCGSFTGTTNILGTLSSRSSAMCDLDDDGDVDLVLHEFHDAPRVLLNDLDTRRPVRWLAIDLEGSRSNRDGLGAKVVVTSGGRTVTRFHDGKSGYLGQSCMPLHFGLGEAASADAVEVRWPSGAVQRILGPVASGTRLRIREEAQGPVTGSDGAPPPP